jgi:Arc/MetJ-type ribon-helix-helix transcriptional regulator
MSDTRKGAKLVAITIKIPEDWVELVDAFRRENPGKLMNRSDVLREALRRMVIEPDARPPTKKKK